MENSAVSEKMPTGEATVTVTSGMHRDRVSIDDFEHVDREASPVEKKSMVINEFETDRPREPSELEKMPKHSDELKEVPESYTAPDDSDEWNLPTQGLMDSSNLENFLRNEKGFMSSELTGGPGIGLDGSIADRPIPTPPSENLIDVAAFSEPLVGGRDLGLRAVNNADFISSEATQHLVNEQGLALGLELGLGQQGGDASVKTESAIGLAMAEDPLVDIFKSPMSDGDHLQGTTMTPKSTVIDTLKSDGLNTSPVDTKPPSPIVDTSEPSFEQGLDQFIDTLERTDLPSKQPEVSYPTVPEAKPAETIPFVKPVKEPKKMHFSKEADPGVGLDEITEPMELFCKMGLDAWFKPERLHPTVVELVYWRDPKKSGVVFGSILGVLLSLSYFSLISVIAYLSLALLTGTIAYRIYKNIIQAVQKTSDGHPFKEILELDLTLPQDKVREMTDVTVTHLNAAALELRRLFLVEDLVDSIKFGVLLWCLTYLGSWFNGMTIIIIMFVAMFTLPKVYENNKTQIDQNLEIVRAKLAEVSAKVKAAVPIGKKPVVEEKKEQ